MPPNQLYLLPYDGHPSRAAYSIVANAIFEQVEGKVREILAAKRRAMREAIDGKEAVSIFVLPAAR